jgi:DNA replication protein DnaC
MARALETLDQTLSQLEKGEISAIEAIDALLAEELTLREGRRIGVGLRTARLTPIKTLESFDFSFQPSLDRHRIMALAQLEFINRAEVLHFLGPPGTGKSHLATAFGVAAVKAGRSVYRCTLAERIDGLAQAERERRLAEKIRFHARASLLIVDEIGYLPITSGGANLFFQLVNARYEKGALAIVLEPMAHIARSCPRTAASQNGVRSSEIPSWRRRFWTGCSITPSSCRSKAPAIDYAATLT